MSKSVDGLRFFINPSKRKFGTASYRYLKKRREVHVSKSMRRTETIAYLGLDPDKRAFVPNRCFF